jgi:pilus assembly protein CpaC
VSQLSSSGSVQLNGFTVPALVTRRAETTVELGSGQSFMIGGLMSNTTNNSIDKAPFLGDLPVLGNLFRSKSFRRSETELVIIVTPYLVKPVSANEIALPTDGYRQPNEIQSTLMGQSFSGKSGEQRPKPTASAPITVKPAISSTSPSAPVATSTDTNSSSGTKQAVTAASPGFSFN